MDFHLSISGYEQIYPYKYLTLYHALRDAIAAGQIPSGTRLPSSRELGRLYQVSRGIVNQVYEMLAAEGYVESSVGRGTFVLFDGGGGASNQTASPVIFLSDWGKRIARLPLRTKGIRAKANYDFSLVQPDAEHFPRQVWNKLMYEQVRNLLRRQTEDEYATQGNLALREALVHYLQRARGIVARADQIAIVSGSVQAIALLSHLLVNPGEEVIVEDPGYVGTRRAIEAVGGIAVRAQVDAQGILPENWQARLAFVTPSRQFPTGAVLSLDRRQQLLKWAHDQQAILIEDDYDSEFRHGGRPIEPLKALDQEGSVVYIGTFSITLHPDLRIGYAVLPDPLVEAFCKAKQLFEPHPVSIMEQRALAALMNGGFYEKHLRKMKRIYSRKYHLMASGLQLQLGHLFDFVPADAGLHVFGWWKRPSPLYQTYLERCMQAGVKWSNPAHHFIEPGRPAALFTFAHLSEPDIAAGIQLMASIWRDNFDS